MFGAVSGNYLTKATKYAATSFFVLAIVLGVMQSKTYYRNSAEFRRSVEQESQRNPAAAQPAPPTTTPAVNAEAAPDSGGNRLLTPGTNATPPK